MSKTSRAKTKRGSALLLLLSCLLAVGSWAAGGAALAADGKAKEAPSRAGDREQQTFYASSIGRSDGDFLIVHYWSKGPRFRSHTTINGHPVVTIVNGPSYWIFDPSLGTGVEIVRSAEAVALDAKRDRPFGRERADIIASGGEKLRSETLDGREVDVYQATNDQGRRTLWVTQGDLHLPLRLESFDRKSGRSGRLDYVTWRPGLYLVDEFFTPPPDIEIRRFESYAAYMAELRKGPVPPAPPLFRTFLRADE